MAADQTPSRSCEPRGGDAMAPYTEHRRPRPVAMVIPGAPAPRPLASVRGHRILAPFIIQGGLA